MMGRILFIALSFSTFQACNIADTKSQTKRAKYTDSRLRTLTGQEQGSNGVETPDYTQNTASQTSDTLSNIELRTDLLDSQLTVEDITKLNEGTSTGTTEKRVSQDCSEEACSILSIGEYLDTGDKRTSSNGEYELVMQSDGNLCIYKSGTQQVTWCSSTFLENARFYLRTKGNLEISNRKKCWSPNALADTDLIYAQTDVLKDLKYVKVTDDGHLVAYTAADLEIWSNAKALTKQEPLCILYAPELGPDPSRNTTTFEAPPKQYGAYYKRYAKTHGVQIFGTASVSDDSMQLTYNQIDQMMTALQPQHQDKFQNIILVLMSKFDKPSQMQFFTSLDKTWVMQMETQYRGGVTGNLGLVTEELICRTENITDQSYRELDQVVHEFGHIIDGALLGNLKNLYTPIINSSTPTTNIYYNPTHSWAPVEYWAASVQNWFYQDFSYVWQPIGGPYKSISRETMQKEDPNFYKFMQTIFTDMPAQLTCKTEYAKTHCLRAKGSWLSSTMTCQCPTGKTWSPDAKAIPGSGFDGKGFCL